MGISFFLETETSSMFNQEILLFIDCETNFYKRYYIKGIDEVYEIFVSMRILRFSTAFSKEKHIPSKRFEFEFVFLECILKNLKLSFCHVIMRYQETFRISYLIFYNHLHTPVNLELS